MTEFNRPKLDSQTYVTLGYLLIVIIGMMFDFDYYNRFGINIFEYADILDFLLAPVKNIQLMIFAIGSGMIVTLIFQMDKYWQERNPKTYEKYNLGMTNEFIKKYRPILFLVSLVGYFYMASIFYGERMYNKYQEGSESIEVIFESDQRVLQGKLIGKNTDYIFIENKDKSVRAIPVASDIQEIVISRP